MSIILEGVCKHYRTRQGFNPILKNVNLRVEPGEHVGILGQNGSGKSTLIRVLSGSEPPTSGTVERQMSVSWPLAFGGAFLGALTGLDNIRFVCRLYGVDPTDKLPFVEDFTELGRYLREPVKSYSSGMRARLAFATSMAVDFDCYLIDEIVAVGDDRFQRKCEEELFEKRRDRAMLIVSHSATYVQEHCHRASVLVAGALTNFSNVDDAYQFYASHELALQPHMAVPVPGANEPPSPVDLDGAYYALIERGDCSGVEIERLAREFRVHEAEVFDACDLVGRLGRSGHDHLAIETIGFLARERPKETLFLVTKGDMLARLRQHRPAVAAYRAALVLDPQNYWANRNLAEEFYNVGRYVDAHPLFLEAASLAPDLRSATELAMRATDCRAWGNEILAAESTIAIDAATVLVMERSCVALVDSSCARIAFAGLLHSGIDIGALRCSVLVAGEDRTLSSVLPSASLRRFAAAEGLQAFAFTLYTPIDPAQDEVRASFNVAGLPVCQDQVAVHRIGGGLAMEDMLASARLADSTHQSEAATLLYGLQAQAGGQVDIERFAENLIATGLYHEAEERLIGWRNAHQSAEHEPEASAVLDLVCVELCRSRVPGWQSEVERCLEWARSKRVGSSYLANLGHHEVAAGKIKDAAALYAQASEHLGAGTLIHFARGVHTARFLTEVAAPSVEQKPPLAAPKHDLVHLFACDGRYFERFAESLVRSSVAAVGKRDVVVHAHIVDPSETTMTLARSMADQLGMKFTTESSPSAISDESVRRAYFTCARFLIASELLETYGCPILVTETDALINWSWDDIGDHVTEGAADVGFVHSATWNWVPWTKVPAGIYLFAPTVVGRAWCDYISRFLRHAFVQQSSATTDVWTVDQVALWLAQALAPAGSRTVHLPMSSILTLATGDKTNVLAAA